MDQPAVLSAPCEKVVVVTRKTQLEELVERFNSVGQAKFYLNHSGADFGEYDAAHRAYHQSLDHIRATIPSGVRHQFIDRSFLPTFSFGPSDLVVALGQDGLVVNIAKYLGPQPLLAINPDPSRIDGILLPFLAQDFSSAIVQALSGGAPVRRVAMARASLSTGQSLHAVNDLFIGQRTHVSARYEIGLGDDYETQSSSGIIVSTGVGSTGWFRSVVTGAARFVNQYSPYNEPAEFADYRRDWEAPELFYSVREPFESRTTSANMVYGRIEQGEELELVSLMPQNGVIFSDGIEQDYLEFNSGVIARIGLAQRRLHLIVA